jgi:hypothetical protein
VQRPTRFEGFRYLGDKRTQLFYDLDRDDPDVEARVTDVVQAESFVAFCPDVPAEARNRGYRAYRSGPTAGDADA